MSEEVITLDSIKATFETNPDLKSALQAEIVDKNVVAAYLETEDGKSLTASKMDAYASKAIGSWKEKNLPKIIADKVNELHPPKSPEAIQMQEMQVEIQKIKSEKEKLAMTQVATNALAELGLDTSLAEMVIGDSPETTKHNVKNLEFAISAEVQKQADVKLKTNAAATAPSNGNGTATKATTKYTKLSDISDYQVVQDLYDNDRDEYDRLQAAD